jgi:hypothetical protein
LRNIPKEQEGSSSDLLDKTVIKTKDKLKPVSGEDTVSIIHTADWFCEL